MDRPTSIRARLARATRAGESPEVITELRRDYYAARAVQYVRDWISSDPAPTPAQRHELVELLMGGDHVAA